MTVEPPAFPDRREDRVRVGDQTLHVTDWGGQPEHGCLFFSHPTGFLGAVWKPLLLRLRRLGVQSRLVTYDQRGHGLSSKPDDDYAWENFVSDTVGLMRALGLRDAIGIGHSAGATTLAGAAAEDPSLLRRLVMIDPVLFDRELARLVAEAGPDKMSARTRTRRMVWPSRRELLRSYRHREPYSTWIDEALETYVAEGTFERPDGEIELLCPARIEGQVYSSAAGSDGFAWLGRAGLPILILRGENSRTFDRDRARRAIEAAPNARLHTVSGTGHFIPMERPDEVARLVVAELGEGA